MISISHWGMFDVQSTYRMLEVQSNYRAMTNREKLALHIELGLIDERFA